MALITRCPACGTMFKVVPDQLRISEGWVRCGHCAEIFDASAHLQNPADATPAHPPPDSAAVPLAESAAREQVPSAAPEPSDSSLQFPPDSSLPSLPDSTLESAPESVLESQIDEGVTGEEPDPAEIDAQAQALREDPLDRPFELRREDLGPHSESAVPEPEPEPAPPPAEADSTLEDLTFVRQARREARWRRPAVRVALSLVLVVLGLLLAGQVAVHERNRLAASEPALRPWLVQLCLAVECRIQPPRQIDAIAIDSSSFNKLRPDTYRLQVTLKNQAATEVAMPALELTLTDSQDRPVVRRVLLPGELGASRPALAGATEWSGSVAFALLDNSLGSRIAGYRLLAFYP